MLKPFIGLIKKEFLLARFQLFLGLIILVLSFLGLIIWILRSGEFTLVIPALVFYLILHVFLMPLTLYQLLKIEGQTQTWLYNPQSSVKLLLAKFLVSLFIQFTSQLFVVIFIIILNVLNLGTPFIPAAPIILTFVLLLLITSFISMWVLFLWTVYHSLNKVPFLKYIRWIIILLIVYGYSLFDVTIMTGTPIFSITNGVPIHGEIILDYNAESGWVFNYSELPIPYVVLIYYSIISILLFLASKYLLDKHVEV